MFEFFSQFLNNVPNDDNNIYFFLIFRKAAILLCWFVSFFRMHINLRNFRETLKQKIIKILLQEFQELLCGIPEVPLLFLFFNKDVQYIGNVCKKFKKCWNDSRFIQMDLRVFKDWLYIKCILQNTNPNYHMWSWSYFYQLFLCFENLEYEKDFETVKSKGLSLLRFISRSARNLTHPRCVHILSASLK